MIDPVLEYWESRADLGYTAGGPDTGLKMLEIDAIGGYVRDGMRVLDAGCGNGITAFELVRRYAIEMVGIDYSPRMIEAARDGAAKRGRPLVFRLADIRDLPDDLGMFDLIYTERCLVNLPDWETQCAAIRNLIGHLAPAGTLVLCEASQDGLDAINDLRQTVGLPTIRPPFHNRYLRQSELATLDGGCVLRGPVEFSSTYYLLSRVVNALVAAGERRMPTYDDTINLIALRLPNVGTLGQAKLWTWGPA